MAIERFSFVKSKVTGLKMFVVDSGIIVCRVPTPNPVGFETIEVNEEEVELTEDD